MTIEAITNELYEFAAKIEMKDVTVSENLRDAEIAEASGGQPTTSSSFG